MMDTQPVPTVPRLVASDVDGTLLDSEEQVSERTRRAVKSLVAAGVPFVLASGRPPRWIPPVADGLGHAPLAVCGNGAVIYDSNSDRVLQAFQLEAATLGWLAELAGRLLPGCGLAAERVGVGAHDAVTPQFVSTPEYQHAWLNPDNTAVSPAEVVDAPAIKMLVRVVGATSESMRLALEPHLEGRADLTYSTDNGLVELSAPGVTKASGLAAVAARYQVDVANIIAFGDMPNDIPMLTMVGHGVAMANAHPRARAAADEITTTNDADGVAEVLERWW